jgi:hypothetical protein
VVLRVPELIPLEGMKGKKREQAPQLQVAPHGDIPARETESFLMPLLIRLLTVPSGAPSRLAVSV